MPGTETKRRWCGRLIFIGDEEADGEVVRPIMKAINMQLTILNELVLTTNVRTTSSPVDDVVQVKPK